MRLKLRIMKEDSFKYPNDIQEIRKNLILSVPMYIMNTNFKGNI